MFFIKSRGASIGTNAACLGNDGQISALITGGTNNIQPYLTLWTNSNVPPDTINNQFTNNYDITISNLPVNGQVVITDLNGKIAQSQAISATDSLTISDLKAGVYFVTIATELGSKTEKLIIQ